MKIKSVPQHHVIEQVPVNYYQEGIKKNRLQKFWHTNKLKIVLDFLSFPSRKILDVGCASGWFISEIEKHFEDSHCYGIDIYDKAIVFAQETYPHITFKVADAHRIPYKNSSFDTVICTEVLEHVDNPKLVLLEMKRVLRKGGIAVVELDSGSILFSLAWFLWRKLKGKVWNDAHLHSYSVKKLENQLTLCDLKIERKKKFNFGMAMAFLVRKK